MNGGAVVTPDVAEQRLTVALRFAEARHESLHHRDSTWLYDCGHLNCPTDRCDVEAALYAAAPTLDELLRGER